MDDFDTAHKQPRPLRARGGPAHPTLAKSGRRPYCSAPRPHRSFLTSSFSPALAAAVPLGSRARRLPRAQTQQMAAAQPERDE